MSRAAALSALRQLYADLERELAELRPKCELSGRCCNFLESGHTLFASDLELAQLATTTPLRAALEPGDARLCPWWKKGLCEAREGRPLGCRVYFCDGSKAPQLEELSVRFHARLKRLHDDHAVAYRYEPFVRRVRELARETTATAPAEPPRRR
jgi:Fe-S-cluster containining protein